MKKFIYDKERFELETIINHYTCMFNSRKFAPFEYTVLQKINPEFPHIDDDRFWGKLNTVFIANYSMDLEQIEEVLPKGIEGEPFRRSHIFQLIKEKSLESPY